MRHTMIFIRAIVTFLAIMLGLFAGCQKSDNPVNSTGDIAALEDAAASVAASLSISGGGAVDQIGDIATISSAAGMQNEAGAMLSKYAEDSVITTVTKTYDSSTGWWTLTLSRQRTGDFGYADIYRAYQYQFLNKSGGFQQYWLTGPDTAYAIHFRILSGTGYLHTLHLTHHLVSLSGEWMVTGTNTTTITINTFNSGVYTRIGSDTITTDVATRTFNHTLTMTFINVTGPRGSRLNLAAKTGGTITGTYHAPITFTRGSLYTEKTIDETFTITFGGDGDADIDMGGRRFVANVGSGLIIR